MKYLTAIYIALALPCLVAAQSNFSKTYPLKGAKNVLLEFQYGDIKIEKHNGTNLIVEGNVTINGENGIDKFEFDVKESTTQLTFTAKADFDEVDRRMTIVMNDGTKIYKKGGGNFSWDNMKNEDGVDKVYNGVDVDAEFIIKVPANANLEVSSTYGEVMITNYWEQMKIHSTYGSVDVILNNPPAIPEFKISSTYSNVDLTLPQSANANLRMTTGYGKIYTDMDIDTDIQGSKQGEHHGEDIKATLNNGTGSISLDARYSNVYLRKKL